MLKECIVSHVLVMRQRLEKMAGLVEKNLTKAQYNQKQWYDHCARQWRFKTGDQGFGVASHYHIQVDSQVARTIRGGQTSWKGELPG